MYLPARSSTGTGVCLKVTVNISWQKFGSDRTAHTIFKLHARENETLLVRWYALLILDHTLQIVNRVYLRHLKRNCGTGKDLDEDLVAPRTDWLARVELGWSEFGLRARTE